MAAQKLFDRFLSSLKNKIYLLSVMLTHVEGLNSQICIRFFDGIFYFFTRLFVVISNSPFLLGAKDGEIWKAFSSRRPISPPHYIIKLIIPNFMTSPLQADEKEGVKE